MSNSPTILIVEDEAKIAGLLRDYLEQTGGFRTHMCESTKEGRMTRQMPVWEFNFS